MRKQLTRRKYVSPLSFEVTVRLERGFLQNSIVTDEMSVEVEEFEAVTFTNPDAGFETDFFDAEFK